MTAKELAHQMGSLIDQEEFFEEEIPEDEAS